MLNLYAAPRAAATAMLRFAALAGIALSLAACDQTIGVGFAPDATLPSPPPRYAALRDGSHAIPAVAADVLDQSYLRQRVRYETHEPTGTIVVDPDSKYLYLVMENGMAMRYGIGVGREGFGWSGTASVQRKAQWPRWTPPDAMVRRQPELVEYRSGMAPGLGNPLGARALYLYENGKDTLYRIHGTNEPDSIGKNVSSGCIRLLNQDVIDLFNRVPVGSKVVVRPSSSNRGAARTAAAHLD